MREKLFHQFMKAKTKMQLLSTIVQNTNFETNNDEIEVWEKDFDEVINNLIKLKQVTIKHLRSEVK